METPHRHPTPSRIKATSTAHRRPEKRGRSFRVPCVPRPNWLTFTSSSPGSQPLTLAALQTPLPPLLRRLPRAPVRVLFPSPLRCTLVSSRSRPHPSSHIPFAQSQPSPPPPPHLATLLS